MKTNKKILYLSIFLLGVGYFILGIYGLVIVESDDIDSFKSFMTITLRNELALGSFIAAVMVFYLLRDIKLKVRQDLPQSKHFKKGALIFLFLIFVVLLFACSEGILLVINSKYGNQETVTIRGIVVRKYYENGSRNSKAYFMDVKDTIINKIYHLRVDKNIYRFTDKDSLFNQEFKKGYFGIIYKND